MKPRPLPPQRAERIAREQAWAALSPAVRDVRERANLLKANARTGQRLLTAGNFDAFLLFCRNGNRLHVFRSLARHMADAEYWRLLRETYQHCENAWQYRTLPRLLTAKRAGRAEHFMDDAERAVLDALPDPVTVHRGAKPHNVEGWSWTLDPERARWFALRFFNPVGLVVHGHVARADIIAYLDGREETEVVCDPACVALDSVDVVRPTASDTATQGFPQHPQTSGSGAPGPAGVS